MLRAVFAFGSLHKAAGRFFCIRTETVRSGAMFRPGMHPKLYIGAENAQIIYLYFARSWSRQMRRSATIKASQGENKYEKVSGADAPIWRKTI